VTQLNGDRYHWQDEFVARYHALNQENFTLVACPGAGKTRAALRLARELIETGIIDFLWIVCPIVQVKKQWWLAAGKLGIDIEWTWDNGTGALASDMTGAAVTYSAVSNQPDLHRYHVGRHKTLVIFDEIHHADEEQAWGTKSQQAFGLATRRIMLSGTPFRRVGTIPFVTYEPDPEKKRDGEFVRADYTYDYDRAVREFVCRSIYFPRAGGQVEWEWKEAGFTHTFEDKLSQSKAAMRLRAAIAADVSTINPVAEQMLRDANEKLSNLRDEGDSRAGGLVIAMGKDPATGYRHANALADHMERLFKRRPPVVIGEEAGSLKKIEDFAKSTERWLVSINMVSEGVDIPRLRVLAYLTNIRDSEMYFDQAAGRICRGEDDAFFFIPDDPFLRIYAQRLADLRKTALKQTEEPGEGPGGEPGSSSFRSVGGNPEDAGVIFGSHRIDRAEYVEAQGALEGSGWPPPVPHEVIAKYVLARRGQQSPGPRDGTADDFGGLKSERKERLRKIQNQLVRAWCFKTGNDFAAVNADLNHRVGISKLRHATEDQLIHRLKLAQELSSD
jgi:superfamily II DNA or RNA helicase